MSDINEMNVGLRWYLAHTYSGYEKKVRDNLVKIVENRGLGDLICDIRIPTRVTIKKSGDTEKEVEEIIYPSYVFIKMVMNDETWHAVRNIGGVTGFVGPGSRPTPLSNAEVASLNIEETPNIVSAYNIGDTVVITNGVFEGFTGTIQFISEDLLNVTVLIKRGTRDMPVTLDMNDIKLNEAK